MHCYRIRGANTKYFQWKWSGIGWVTRIKWETRIVIFAIIVWCGTVNSWFKKVHFSFLKSRVVWFKKNLCTGCSNSIWHTLESKMGTFEFYQFIFKKVILAGLSSLWQKRCQNSIWYFMILPKKTFFQNVK